MLINEIHYTDIYPKSFETFRQEYLPIVKNGEGKDLFVQFTNYADNTFDRKGFDNPDHHDPVGVYGYPLEYVLYFPLDVWYGQRAKYLRVLKNTAKNVLDLQHPMSKEEVFTLLSKIPMKEKGYYYHNYPDSIQDFFDLAFKRYKFKGDNKNTKAFWTIIQNKLQYGTKTDPYSGMVQTRRLRQCGYDAVLDNSTTSYQAVINSREPEQIIFLTRNSFKVEKIYTLRHNVAGDGTLTHYNEKDSFPKLAGLIAKGMQDVLTGKVIDKYEFGSVIFKTKHGRTIEIDKGLGKLSGGEIKSHRHIDINTTKPIKIKVHTEKGMIEQTFEDMTYQEMAIKISEIFHRMNTADANFVPSYLDDQLPEIKQLNQEWSELAQFYKISWPEITPVSGRLLLQITHISLGLISRSGLSYKRMNPDTVMVHINQLWPRYVKTKPAYIDAMTMIIKKFLQNKNILATDLINISSPKDMLRLLQ